MNETCQQCIFFTPKRRVDNQFLSWCSRQGHQQHVLADDTACSSILVKTSVKKERVQHIATQSAKIQQQREQEMQNVQKTYAQIRSYKQQIQEESVRYGYYVEHKPHGMIVQTSRDTWLLDVTSSGIRLFHENQRRFHGYHEQHDFDHTDIARLFRYFEWHESYSQYRYQKN